MHQNADIGLIDHYSGETARESLKRIGQNSSIAIKRTIYNMTLGSIDYYESGIGVLCAEPTRNTYGVPSGLYILYELRVPVDAKITNYDSIQFPMLHQIIREGKLENKRGDRLYTYTQFVSEWDLRSNAIVHDKLSKLYVGFKGANWSMVRELCEYTTTYNTTNEFRGWYRKIIVVDDHRDYVYITGYKAIQPIVVVKTRMAGKMAGYYVTLTDEMGQPYVKYYQDAQSCRDELDIPVFERYSEAEAVLVSPAEKERQRKAQQTLAAERLKQKAAEAQGTQQTLPPKEARGDVLLRIVDRLLRIVGTFVDFFYSPVPKPVKR